MVGSMVQFKDGKPEKSGYRRFKIRSLDNVDDTAALAEVVTRRYSRLISEDASMPDLIVIDGGKGQLSSAFQAMRNLQLRIPIISLAKKMEEIFLPGLPMPIRLQRNNPALQYLQEIRDEAHRFAIKYNRLLRSKMIRK
jgi:excinuclease ABC subunit C